MELALVVLVASSYRQLALIVYKSIPHSKVLQDLQFSAADYIDQFATKFYYFAVYVPLSSA